MEISVISESSWSDFLMGPQGAYDFKDPEVIEVCHVGGGDFILSQVIEHTGHVESVALSVDYLRVLISRFSEYWDLTSPSELTA